MPRALKCSDEEKIRILDEYIVVVRHGNTDKIKFTDIASYACEKGYTNLKEFDFRQNDAVKKHIQDIQDGRVILSNTPVMPRYEHIEVSELVRGSSNVVSTLISTIADLDTHCGQYSEKLLIAQGNLANLQSKYDMLQQETRLMENELSVKTAEVAELKLRLKAYEDTRKDERLNYLEQQLRNCASFITKYVKADIASVLVSKVDGICAQPLRVLDPDAVTRLLEGDPQPVPRGTQELETAGCETDAPGISQTCNVSIEKTDPSSDLISKLKEYSTTSARSRNNADSR